MTGFIRAEYVAMPNPLVGVRINVGHYSVGVHIERDGVRIMMVRWHWCWLWR